MLTQEQFTALVDAINGGTTISDWLDENAPDEKFGPAKKQLREYAGVEVIKKAGGNTPDLEKNKIKYAIQKLVRITARMRRPGFQSNARIDALVSNISKDHKPIPSK